jgi:hypothetical protein
MARAASAASVTSGPLTCAFGNLLAQNAPEPLIYASEGVSGRFQFGE